MARTPQDVTPAELPILRLLWGREGATIRELTDELYPDGGASDYATVQKLLERLENKRFVGRKRGGTAHRFHALVDRDGLIDRRLKETADSLCDGSFAPLLTQLVRNERLSTSDREALRRIVEQLGGASPRRGRKDR